MRDQLHKAAVEAIQNNDELNTAQKQVAVGKITREAAAGHKREGKSVAEIAELLGIAESSVLAIVEKQPEIKEHETIWFPGTRGRRVGHLQRLRRRGQRARAPHAQDDGVGLG